MQTRFEMLSAALLAGLVVSPAVFAQSNELSVLAGVGNPSANVSVGTGISVSGGVSASVQVDYAHRVKELSSGNLYFELPVTRVFKASVGIGANGINVAQSQFFVTPGLRYAFAPTSRVSPYAVGGFGFGWFDSVRVAFEGPFTVNAAAGMKPAAGFGAGAEVRITRGFALRAEVRDFVNCATAGSSRNHVVFNAGFGFHF